MKRTTDDLVRIAYAGGGFTIDAKNYTTNELVRISAAASKHGSRIHILNANRNTTDELVRIAAASKGCVTFEL
jgi:DNA replication protein